MLIRRAMLIPYEVPFKTPVKIGGRLLTVRSGDIIELEDDLGHRGRGEIAPLPGLSPESLEEARTIALGWMARLPGSPSLDGLCSSVVFGIETALWDLCEKRRARRTGRSIGALPLPPVCGLLHPGAGDGGDERVSEQVAELVKAGFRTIKIKVARRTPEEDAATIARVIRALPPGVRLRLDANRRWDLDAALAFAGKLAGGGAHGVEHIEYIEEPVNGYDGRDGHDGIVEFHRRTGLTVALDESLVGVDPGAFNIPDGVGALVLKPLVLGGIRRARDFARRARTGRSRGALTPVISSCFEAGPGYDVLEKLAALLQPAGTASGLDTVKYLQHRA